MKKIDPFETLNDGEWLLVHSGAVTNTNPGSLVEVRLNTERICPNMTNAEFRREALYARDRAVTTADEKIADLRGWPAEEQAHVVRWFGKANAEIRQKLITGLTACVRVMSELTAYNFTRFDSERFKHVGCMLVPPTPATAAEVCRPDTATHTIAIHPSFCGMGPLLRTTDSKASTIFHEVTHFMDTFGSLDHRYGLRKLYEQRFGEKNPDLAIENADSIAGYVFYRP